MSKTIDLKITNDQNETDGIGARKLSCTISISRRIRLPDFEHADLFVCTAGVTADTTQAEIDALLDGPGRMAYDSMIERLTQRIAAVNETLAEL